MAEYVLIALKVFCAVMFALALVAACSKSGYAGILSKTHSVTPERHSGFFAPVNWPASQAEQINRASVLATQTRLNSVYDGMTRPNKPAMANKSGGTMRPRVNPVTLIFSVASQSQMLIGGSHA